MDAIGLKNKIINQIAGIQDTTVLSAIRDFIESESTSAVHKTAPEQRKNKKEDRRQPSKEDAVSIEPFEGATEKWCKGKMLIP